MAGRVERDRQRQFAREVSSAEPRSRERKLSFVGQVVKVDKLATEANCYVLVNPVDIGGDESEGGTPDLEVDMERTVAVVLLNHVPAVGDNLICRPEGNRWVADKPGGSPGSGGGVTTIPGCSCTAIPDTLNMVSTFAGVPNYKYYQSATFTYQILPFDILHKGYISNVCVDAFGFSFQYYLACQYSLFTLSQYYPPQKGLPGALGLVIYNWLIGGLGNTCNPFALKTGYVTNPANTSTFMTITG